MKIVVDGRMINHSGIGVYTNELLQILNKKSHSVVILLNRKDASTHNFENLQVRTTEFGRYSWKNLFYLRKHIKNSDIYFCPFLSIPPLFSKIPVVTTVHDLCPVSERNVFGIRVAIAYWMLMLLQLTVSKQVVTISNFTRSEINKWFCGIFDGKVSVVPNGLSIKKQTNHTEPPYPIDTPYILTVGNIKPHKNIINLARTFLQSKWCTTHRLVIVGEHKGFRTKEQEVTIDDSRIIFTGRISNAELDQLYQDASLFVYPSFYEGFGLPLLEAMSYQLPIACSSIPPFHEIAGDSVTYFNPNCLNTFWDNLTSFAPPNNYDAILSKYTWKATLEQLLTIFKQASSSSLSSSASSAYHHNLTHDG